MRLLHISDTHCQHTSLMLPEADIIVHSGDFTFGGSEQEAKDFFDWFCKLPYRHKVVVAGNHDCCLYDANLDTLPDDVHYLCGTSCVIEGLHFHGIPLFMEDVLDGNLLRMYFEIPPETDILVTHEPPYGFCDLWRNRHAGNRTLANAIDALPNLRYHLFGHQHDAFGTAINGKVLFANAALVDSKYNLKFSPNLFEV